MEKDTLRLAQISPVIDKSLAWLACLSCPELVRPLYRLNFAAALKASTGLLTCLVLVYPIQLGNVVIRYATVIYTLLLTSNWVERASLRGLVARFYVIRNPVNCEQHILWKILAFCAIIRKPDRTAATDDSRIKGVVKHALTMRGSVTATPYLASLLLALAGCAHNYAVIPDSNGSKEAMTADLKSCNLEATHAYYASQPPAGAGQVTGLVAGGLLGGAIGGAIAGAAFGTASANDGVMKLSDIDPYVDKCMAARGYSVVEKQTPHA